MNEKDILKSEEQINFPKSEVNEPYKYHYNYY